MNKYKEAADLIKKSKNIIVLTGAGISTESGVKDFRSSDGLNKSLHEGYGPEEILSNQFFYENTEIFYEYLGKHLNVDGVVPNLGHNILVELEASKNITIITQNIDALHQEAGSTNVIELHGSLMDTTCIECFKKKSLAKMLATGYRCACGGVFKPEVVLYGEDVPSMREAIRSAEKADLLIVLGTSLEVYPAASIPEVFGVPFKPSIIINKDKTSLSEIKNVLEFNSGIGKTLEMIMEKY